MCIRDRSYAALGRLNSRSTALRLAVAYVAGFVSFKPVSYTHLLRRRSEPALTRKPGDLPDAVVLRADRVCRADGGEPERRHGWTAFSRAHVVRPFGVDRP